MEIEAMNEAVLLYRPEKQGTAKYSAQAVLQGALSVRTTKGLVSFLEVTPYAFLKALRAESFCLNSLDTQDAVPFDEILHLEHEPVLDLAKGLEGCLAKHYPAISYLDDFVLKSGDLGMVGQGDIPSCPEYNYSVDMTGKGYAVITVWDVVEFIAKMKALLKYIAVANRREGCGSIKTIEKDGRPIAKIADYGFEVSSDADYCLPIQRPEVDELFDKKDFLRLSACLGEFGLKSHEGELLKDPNNEALGCPLYFVDSNDSEVPVYPPHYREGDIAANIVTSAINNALENSNNSFSLQYVNGSFSVCQQEVPMQSLCQAITELAIANSVHLCPVCKTPVIEKRRGDTETFCSNTCKTKANNDRRDKAFMMAAAGIPIEQAIETIDTGADTIKRWYEKAQALTSHTDPSAH
jgi:predicted nucleic acid-binding Zn ribbon protein